MQVSITDIPLLSADECARLTEIVRALRGHWIPRGEGTYWTLGASTYTEQLETYYGVAAQNNPLIDHYFTGLLTKVKQAIAGEKGAPVIDLWHAGRPGFHIFDERAAEIEGPIHTDEPFQRVYWPGPFADPFSFTLALSLTRGQGGMDYWDGEVAAEAVKTDTVTGLTVVPNHYYPYAIGHLYLHDGRFPHRIAKPIVPTAEEPRITLQGHGALLLEAQQIAVYF